MSSKKKYPKNETVQELWIVGLSGRMGINFIGLGVQASCFIFFSKHIDIFPFDGIGKEKLPMAGRKNLDAWPQGPSNVLIDGCQKIGV